MTKEEKREHRLDEKMNDFYNADDRRQARRLKKLQREKIKKEEKSDGI